MSGQIAQYKPQDTKRVSRCVHICGCEAMEGVSPRRQAGTKSRIPVYKYDNMYDIVNSLLDISSMPCS
jgi:hypothetical protein